ncbi:MAG: TIGR01777 family oxidoreductase [Chloroflexota bacterium]|nr:TIGR01777 family oxidoreductase [Chloroflexota bacterium]MDE2918739.1 TIGR01777 family oxidoreductase [Chloroflexota bacterium]
MRVAVSGSTGLVGAALVDELRASGHEVVRLVRPATRLRDAGDIAWDPDSGDIDKAALEGTDAVVHLAGETISALRWTADKRRRIRESRVRGTDVLARAIAGLSRKPRVLVCAGATGYYGDRGDEVLDEKSPPGRGFLPGVSVEWEAATQPAAQAGIRVAIARLAPVIDARSPVVARMRLPVMLGLGGWFGSGRHYWPWIALDDVVGVFHLALERESVSGPIVVAAPEAVTNREFVKTMGRVLHRPVLLPVPSPILRTALGDFAREALLSSQRMVPRKLLDTGYEFRQPHLESALRAAVRSG